MSIHAILQAYSMLLINGHLNLGCDITGVSYANTARATVRLAKFSLIIFVKQFWSANGLKNCIYLVLLP